MILHSSLAWIGGLAETSSTRKEARKTMTDQELGLRKRSLTIARHRTSLALEPIFWRALDEEASERSMSLASLIGEIDKERGASSDQVSLASASRVHVVSRLRSRLDGDGA